MTKPKRPKDANQLAKLIVDIGTGEQKEVDQNEGKNPAAVALGKLGGAKGGYARAAKPTATKRKSIAKKAAKKRWENPKT
ncbi:MAG: hypothetical protein ABUT20_61715 [Bacteroidota bacterium]